MQTVLDDFNKFINTYINHDIKAYGAIFKTGKNYYFFDTGTGKVLSCNKNIYDLLYVLFSNKGQLTLNKIPKQLKNNEADLSEALSELKDAIISEHLFQPMYYEMPHMLEYIQKYDNDGCDQIILELTQSCNFRCNYCIYGEKNLDYRDHGNESMSFETAKKAMDYALEISKNKIPNLTFYGGEPLIKFELMKECIEYYKKKSSNQVISVNFTSNLSLLTEEMANYFYSNKVYITCSLDGNERIHNLNRQLADKGDTFQLTFHNLKLLIGKYGNEAHSHIGINMVFDKPYTYEKLDEIQAFIYQNKFLDGIDVSITYADHYSNEKAEEVDLINQNYVFTDVIGDWTFDKLRKGNIEVFTKNYLRGRLLKLHNRDIFAKSFSRKGLNSCCIPGVRRIYVDVNGNFSICEKIGEAPYIGNVDEKLNIQIIKQFYFDEYKEKSEKICNECWAVNLCGACYAGVYCKDGLDLNKKLKLCNAHKLAWYKALERYYILYEENRELLAKYMEENDET